MNDVLLAVLIVVESSAAGAGGRLNHIGNLLMSQVLRTCLLSRSHGRLATTTAGGSLQYFPSHLSPETRLAQPACSVDVN
eukprot:scaffold163882_cov51-Attheya_sp.AAC.3